MKEGIRERVVEALKKYRAAAAAVLLGIVLMLLPSGSGQESTPPNGAEEEHFDRAAVQSEMEEILRTIEGVGELRLMLTVDAGTKRELAQDTSIERSGTENFHETRETVIVGAGSGTREIIVTRSVYPRYAGALVVCEGGDSAAVRLAVTEAVRALTGLASDKISVQQGRP